MAWREPDPFGRPYVQEYCWVIRVEDETIKEVEGYYDTVAVAELFR